MSNAGYELFSKESTSAETDFTRMFLQVRSVAITGCPCQFASIQTEKVIPIRYTIEGSDAYITLSLHKQGILYSDLRP